MESASVSTSRPVLHLLCGKIAAGKSTLAHQLAQQTGAVIISEDAWLAHLFAEEMQDVADYVRCAGKLRNAMTPHLISLLQCGVSVVLDFPANTVGQRQWMKAVIQCTGGTPTALYRCAGCGVQNPFACAQRRR